MSLTGRVARSPDRLSCGRPDRTEILCPIHRTRLSLSDEWESVEFRDDFLLH